VATLTFLSVSRRSLQRNVKVKAHTRIIYLLVSLWFLTFVKVPAATRYECQNRDTRHGRSMADTTNTLPASNPLVVWVIAAAIPLMLLAPAFWNGYPVLQSDTGGYLARWYEG